MTLVWAAVISIATTLAMEWFAKPWLEVRKDQILDQRRNVRKLRELAESGAETIASLADMDFRTSHANRANNALRQYRQNLATLKYGLSKKDRKQAEALAKVSNSFAKGSTREAWVATFDDFMHAFAMFRYGTNAEKAHTQLIEQGLVKDDVEE